MIHDDEELRAAVPTAEGVHLHEPDAFPHLMMARLAGVAIGLIAVLVMAWMLAGLTAAMIVGATLLVLVVPIVISRMSREARRERNREIEQELRVEAQEHTSDEPLRRIAEPTAAHPEGGSPGRLAQAAGIGPSRK
jgi:choline-glycine betaine transporter